MGGASAKFLGIFEASGEYKNSFQGFGADIDCFYKFDPLDIGIQILASREAVANCNPGGKPIAF